MCFASAELDVYTCAKCQSHVCTACVCDALRANHCVCVGCQSILDVHALPPTARDAYLECIATAATSKYKDMHVALTQVAREMRDARQQLALARKEQRAFNTLGPLMDSNARDLRTFISYVHTMVLKDVRACGHGPCTIACHKCLSQACFEPGCSGTCAPAPWACPDDSCEWVHGSHQVASCVSRTFCDLLRSQYIAVGARVAQRKVLQDAVVSARALLLTKAHEHHTWQTLKDKLLDPVVRLHSPDVSVKVLNACPAPGCTGHSPAWGQPCSHCKQSLTLCGTCLCVHAVDHVCTGPAEGRMKPCPACGVLWEHAHGCSQVTCLACGATWDFESGVVASDDSFIHNPDGLDLRSGRIHLLHDSSLRARLWARLGDFESPGMAPARHLLHVAQMFEDGAPATHSRVAVERAMAVSTSALTRVLKTVCADTAVMRRHAKLFEAYANECIDVLRSRSHASLDVLVQLLPMFNSATTLDAFQNNKTHVLLVQGHPPALAATVVRL